MNISFIFSTRTAVFPEADMVDAPNFIGGVLAEELINRNHKLTIFASKLNNLRPSAHISGKLNPFYNDYALPDWSNYDFWTKVYTISAYDAELLIKFREKINNVESDIIHFQNHTFYTVLPFITNIDKKMVFTLHNPVSPPHTYIYKKFAEQYSNFNNIHFVAISNFQAKQLDPIMQHSTIPHGTEISSITFNDSPGDEMVFVSRLSKTKGIDTAIKVAEISRKKLSIFGRKSTEDLGFFNNEIASHIDNKLIKQVLYGPREKALSLFGQAKIFLFPVQWEEPFGLVLIESMASGTPVVAYARGSVPEIVKDGETGFIVNPSNDDVRGEFIIKKTGIEGLCEAVEKIYSMPEDKYKQMRKSCREHVEKNFSVEKMVDEYEKVYEMVLSSKI